MSPPSSASGVARALCVQGCELERPRGGGGPHTIRGIGLGAGGGAVVEEHRGCAGRTRGRGACLCVSPSSRPLLPSGPDRSVLLWGGPVLHLSAGWGQNISSGNCVASPGLPKAPEPQGKPGCPLPFASSLQAAPALRLLSPGPSTSAGSGFSPAHPPRQTAVAHSSL